MKIEDLKSSLKQNFHDLRRTVGGFIVNLSNGTVSRKALYLGGFIVLAAITVSFASYKFYEYRVTRGVGFVDATDFKLDEGVGVKAKKETFFGLLKPVVEVENARIRETRQRLKDARNDSNEAGWIDDVAEEYKVEWSGNEWEALLKRVDTIPAELVLVQAANESSWGQSRFAQTGNNIFGQWCFTEGCGMVPLRRTAGLKHEVAEFDSVNEAVHAYLRNINTGGAYRDLRELRWDARQNDRQPTASELAAGLTRYSERGHEYISEIRAMIRVNRPLIQAANNP